MKRFYKTAEEVEHDGHWVICLDGRAVKTPARKPLVVTSRSLAGALADEWNRQGETVDIARMHLTRLINVAIDRTPAERDGMTAEVARYCETDLVCFLASDPADLRSRQIAAWRPIREWAGRALGVVLLEAPEGVLHQPQPPASLDAARGRASEMDDVALTTFVFAMGLYGSALLTFAVAEGELSAEDAYERSILEELWQAEKWGQDAEAEARHTARRTENAVVSAIFSGKN